MCCVFYTSVWVYSSLKEYFRISCIKGKFRFRVFNFSALILIMGELNHCTKLYSVLTMRPEQYGRNCNCIYFFCVCVLIDLIYLIWLKLFFNIIPCSMQKNLSLFFSKLNHMMLQLQNCLLNLTFKNPFDDWDCPKMRLQLFSIVIISVQNWLKRNFFDRNSFCTNVLPLHYSVMIGLINMSLFYMEWVRRYWNLNQLLFHMDRPKNCRDIPVTYVTWTLPIALP